MRKSALYNGTVSHRRLQPVGHSLNYKIFYLLIDLDELGEISEHIPFFSINRRNLVSFSEKDFGARSPADLKAYVLDSLLQNGLDGAVASVRLLCIPRIFGYSFNPLSTYYCFDKDENLVALVYAVSNTFGERHSYVLPACTAGRNGLIRQTCRKEFYVSPFLPMNCRYDFSVLPPGETIALSIRQFTEEQPILNASFVGDRAPLDRRHLAAALVRLPFNSLKVIAGIHWEALKLFLKGVKLVKRSTENAIRLPEVNPPLIEKTQEK
ncbi:DUF1365 family protein [Sneathiella chungangensis]|uniref:DUF1365 family protein n=1 Tax=Sneathiella chungangensis TaxID=1418234 RepID=A0A845MI00_9PROT|nr:DUF1365 domain-containing protein [Sneathiella chungangensis]MZR22897.1 DUF1365 family protein [Sneathiella chungangensis]